MLIINRKPQRDVLDGQVLPMNGFVDLVKMLDTENGNLSRAEYSLELTKTVALDDLFHAER